MTALKTNKFLLLSCLLAFANDLLAADDDGTWTYTEWEYEETVTGCVQTCPPELVIPATISRYSVTSIESYAFPQMHRVRSLVTQLARNRMYRH